MMFYVSYWISPLLSGDYSTLDVANETAPGASFTTDWRSYRGVDVPLACPAGSYCPEGTREENQYLCPAGTYSNMTSLEAAAQCTPCQPGWYCLGQGTLCGNVKWIYVS